MQQNMTLLILLIYYKSFFGFRIIKNALFSGYFTVDVQKNI